MRLVTFGASLLGAFTLSIGVTPAALAQASGQPSTSTSTPAQQRSGTGQSERSSDATRSTVGAASALEAGSNSFTEGQARARLEEAGFSDLQDLRKDDNGFWRARGMRAGVAEPVALDFRGRIAAGPGVSALGTGAANAPASGPAAGVGTAGRPDGSQGNPPSTAVGRAVDRAQGETPRADGTPGNPAGTAVGRAVDGATGSGASGPAGVQGGGTTVPTR